MPSIGKEERRGLIQSFFGKLRFPYLFALLAGLFFVDLFVPDTIPFLDEFILGGLAVLLGMWKDHREQKTPPMKNITPE